MILYFANRALDIAGLASTNLREGFVIADDVKTEDVETGVATFECTISFNKDNRLTLEHMAEVGNYLLRSNGTESEFYTIVDTEIDTRNQEIWIYAEDAGLDLINEIAAEYAATSSQNIEYYINKWIADSGFEIGINECPESTTRKLSWDGEATVTERLASIATQFGNYEISYSFAADGMTITNRYVNIHEKRGKDMGEALCLNREIDRIITKKSITNLATALKCTGGTPEGEDAPITLNGYTYDDGNFYVKNSTVYSREAAEKWGRFGWADGINPTHDGLGFIVRHYSYETLSQSTLCNHAIAELKKICDMEVNYEVEIKKLPDNVKIGDRVNIVDDAGELYLSTRILKLETSETNQTHTATLGEHIIKTGGISQKVEEMAQQFAEQSKSAAKALQIAEQAHQVAEGALEQVEDAIASVEDANEAVQDAVESIAAAKEAAQSANAAAEAAQDIVDRVDEEIAGLEQTINNVQSAAETAQQAAQTADAKAVEANRAALQAQTDLIETDKAVVLAQSTADNAITKAESARLMADSAEGLAAQATWTADAAKTDAAAAVKEVDELSNDLTTLSNTMTADYAKKTELTETTANLQTQITQNAGQISSTASKLLVVDETANNAQELAAQAQTEAQEAQSTAEQAVKDAKASQDAADQAQAAADAAQSEANTAKAAAQTAKNAADEADAKVVAAKQDLATVQGRVDATEEEIEAAQKAVETAQAKANAAHDLADTAKTNAATAQNKADAAYTDAANAQEAADNAAKAAKTAQDTADKAVGDAAAAQDKADEAFDNAATAQTNALKAIADAETAQAKADQAYSDAQDAQAAADAADKKAKDAATNLATAEANLAAVTSRVGATEEEIQAAQIAVDDAKKAAAKAQGDADTAQALANTAKENASKAQTAADNAKTAADQAQADADAAKQAADEAKAKADALEIRVVQAETDIIQSAEQIALMATKTEVANTLGGYYTKSDADAAISVKANEITQAVSATYTTKEDFNDLTIGGRNLLLNTKTLVGSNIGGNGTMASTTYKDLAVNTSSITTGTKDVLQFKQIYPEKLGEQYTLSFYAKGSGAMITYFYGARGYLECAKVVQSNGTTRYANDGMSQWTLTDEWTRYWVTWTLKDTGDVSIEKYVLFRLSGAASANICGVKLEKGNKASDWTPAPEDINARVETAETRITQTENSINAHAQTMTDYGTRIGNLEVSDQNITLSVSNVSKRAEKGITDAAAAKLAADGAQGTANTAKKLAEDAQAQISVEAGKIAANVEATNALGSRMTAVEQTAEGLSVTVGKVSSVKYLVSSYSQPLATLKAWAEDGKDAGTWAVSSTDGVRVGDTAYIRCKNSDTGKYMYIAVVVSSVASATSLRGVSRGFIDPNATDVANNAIADAAAAQNIAESAKAIADAGAKRINTHLRNFTKANWENYGTSGHSENWTTGSSYDNSHISVGDIAYIAGAVSDAGGTNTVAAMIYGEVTAVTSTHVTMSSLYYIMGGEGGAYALANTANNAAAGAQSTADAANTAAGNAQDTADGVKTNLANNYQTKYIPDTRSNNETPTWYIKNYPKQQITEFKYCNTIGLSGETYCALTTTVPWGDSSGGYPKQTAKVAGKEYWRVGISDTVWGSWNDASATATAYMGFDDTNGLIVGNKTSGSWAGYRAQMKNDAFNILNANGTVLASYGTNVTIGQSTARNVHIDSNKVYIRNGSTELASFGASEINLGANSTSAVINVCGGAGSIKQATQTVGGSSISALTVSGTNTRLYGSTSACILAAGGFVQADTSKVWIYSSSSSANAEIRVEPTEVSLLANTVNVTGRNALTIDGMQGVTLKNSLAGNVNVTAAVGNLNATASAGYANISSKHDATITSTDGAVVVDAYDGFSVNSLYGTVGLTAGNGAVAITSTVNNVNLSAASGAVNINAKYGALFPKGDGVGVNFGDYVSALHMDSSGNIGVGKGLQTSGANLWLYGKNINVDATTATYLRINGTTAARLYLSDSLYILRPETDGGATLGTTGVRWNAVNAKILRTYDTSTTSNGVAARVYDNRIYRYNSSSRRYKQDITQISATEIAPERLYNAEVVQFKYKEGYLIDEDTRCGKEIPGFIVEDLEKIYPIAIDYNEDGTPEMWNANILIPPMLKLIQEQHEREVENTAIIEQLEIQIADAILEIAALKKKLNS